MKTFIFSVLKPKDSSESAIVLAIKLKMKDPWRHYSAYPYTRGVNSKLNCIPKHEWTYKGTNEALFRTPRLITFCEATGCRPVPITRSGAKPRSHFSIRTISHCDHTSFWFGPDNEPLILTEPYVQDKGELETEIFERDLSATCLPSPGLYAGRGDWTTSVIMGRSEDRDLLAAVSKKLHAIQWQSAGSIIKLSFQNALILSKQQAREVSYV